MDCPDRLLKLQETRETREDDTQEAEDLMMHEVILLNEKNMNPQDFETNLVGEDTWYLDKWREQSYDRKQSLFSQH